MKRTILMVAAAVLLLSGTAVAQDDDPDCEQDPDQMGCQPECAEDGVQCDHPPCPTDLAGKINEDTGTVFMSWTVNARSDVRVYRATDGGPVEPVAYLDFPATRWIDENVEPGHTYVYSVAHVGMDQEVDDGPVEGPESPRCGHLEISTVPFFGGPVAWAAALGTIGLCAVLMRHR